MDARPLSLCLLVGTFAASAAAERGRRDIEFNGPALSGMDLGDRRAIAVVHLRDGVHLADGALLKGVTAEGGALRAPGGVSLLGAHLDGAATDKRPVRVRIDGVLPAPDPRPETKENENADLSLYLLSYQDGAWEGEGAARKWRPGGE